MFDDLSKKDVNFLPGDLREREKREKEKINKRGFSNGELELTDPDKEEVVSMRRGKSGEMVLEVKKISLQPKKETFIQKLISFFAKKEESIEDKSKLSFETTPESTEKKTVKFAPLKMPDFKTLNKKGELAPPPIRTPMEESKEEKLVMPKETNAQGKGIGVSLIPGAGSEKKINPTLILVLSALIAVFAVGMVYLIISLDYQRINNQLTVEENNIQNIDQEINILKDFNKQIVSLRKKIVATKILLDQHIYWTNFFNSLEKNTLDEVSYAGFNGSLDKEIILKTQGSSEASAARQLFIFQKQNDLVKSVGLGPIVIRISKEEGKTSSFDLRLTINPNIFKFVQ